MTVSQKPASNTPNLTRDPARELVPADENRFYHERMKINERQVYPAKCTRGNSQKESEVAYDVSRMNKHHATE